MKVLLIKDVYKLGRAGDVKKVADGYGRNFLLRQRLAVLATPGSLKTAEKVRAKAEVQRAALNSELQGLADQVNGITLAFPVKAGETGKLYGSITTQDVATAIHEQTRYEVRRQQIDMQPLRQLGEHKAIVRLTVDLLPEVRILVHREGESPESVTEAAAEAAQGKDESAEQSREAGGSEAEAVPAAAEPLSDGDAEDEQA
jgi:large subunit ribosomal protein L9